MNEPAVHVENLSKRYQLGLTHADSLTDLAAGLTRKLKSILPGRRHTDRPTDAPPKQNEFWAVRDVNFDVQPGEVFGIIGRNGAGKSTLLKLISRVTSPTTGRIDLNGRVASLLEVGTGFHPDLTGRENIYMNATLLGMTRREVNQKFDEIIEFAGVGKFLETQVKRYSSGMRVRLGFAVAAHLEPEILIVDEVLTVGDAEFQNKCLGKMKSVATGGRTVLFVSHNMGAIRSLCSRACLMEQGRTAKIGEINDVIGHYLQQQGDQIGAVRNWPDGTTIDIGGTPCLRPLRFATYTSNTEPTAVFSTDQAIELRFDFELLRPMAGLRVGVLVRNADNVTLFGSNTTLAEDLRCKKLQASCTVPGNLLNRGTYTVDLGVDCVPIHIEAFQDEECIRFDVSDVEGHGITAEPLPGVVRPKLKWTVEERAGF
ncbi:ABC transporter ATP-binding protein [Novipirellula rosea]|uniref:ABC transporter ATP-binding protein n=1 Tax=Novipirellula rosea TaxID=1031540 RepID=A0ABP8MJR0_9BACT|tara:strand:- start:22970 stop:24253 length:1284 start_codon:yes stop_codon:yes gene_type:complete